MLELTANQLYNIGGCPKNVCCGISCIYEICNKFRIGVLGTNCGVFFWNSEIIEDKTLLEIWSTLHKQGLCATFENPFKKHSCNGQPKVENVPGENFTYGY